MPEKGDIISKMQGGNPISEKSFGIYANATLKLFKEISDNIKNLSSDKKEKKSFFKKEDPNKFVDQIEPLLEQQNKIQKEILKLQKEQKKKDGKGLLGLLGGIASLAAGALAAGGLIGFLLTGKQEFLFSVIKGFKKLFFDIPREMSRIWGLITKGLRSAFDISKIVKKGGVVKALRKTAIGKVARVAGRKGIKAAGTFALKSMGKAIAKGGAKQVFKKIPVVGTLLGLFFAIQRFQKGDVVGGLLEIASGLSSLVNFIIPGGGLALGLLIDGILLFRDVKGAMKPQAPKETKPKKTTDWSKIPVIGGFVQMFKAVGMVFSGKPFLGAKQYILGMLSIIPIPGLKTLASHTLFPIIDAAEYLVNKAGDLIGKGVKAVKGIKLPSVEEMKQIPVIGTIISGIEGIIDFAKNPKKGVENIVNMVSSVNPVAGMVLGKAAGFVFGAADWFKDKAGKLGIKIKETAGALLKSDEEVQKQLNNQVDAVTGADKKVTPPTPPAKKPSFMSRLGQKLLKISKAAHAGSEQFSVTNIPGKDIQTGIKSQSNVDISGIQPSVWSSFTQMADEYNKTTGRSILMTSGFRSFEEQQKLYEKYGPGRAAQPGKSMHNFGYAIDIDNKMTGAGDTLETSGLLKKYGFNRPMANEPWHIEPVGLKQKYANIQGGGKMVDSGDQQAGDAYAMKNLPKTSIPVSSKSNKSSELNLSDETIKALAAAIGISFKGALPTSRPNQVSIDMGVRG